MIIAGLSGIKQLGGWCGCAGVYGRRQFKICGGPQIIRLGFRRNYRSLIISNFRFEPTCRLNFRNQEIVYGWD